MADDIYDRAFPIEEMPGEPVPEPGPGGPKRETVTPESARPIKTVTPKSVVGFNNQVWLSIEEPDNLRDRINIAERDAQRWVKIKIERSTGETTFTTVDFYIDPKTVSFIGEV